MTGARRPRLPSGRWGGSGQVRSGAGGRGAARVSCRPPADRAPTSRPVPRPPDTRVRRWPPSGSPAPTAGGTWSPKRRRRVGRAGQDRRWSELRTAEEGTASAETAAGHVGHPGRPPGGAGSSTSRSSPLPAACRRQPALQLPAPAARRRHRRPRHPASPWHSARCASHRRGPRWLQRAGSGRPGSADRRRRPPRTAGPGGRRAGRGRGRGRRRAAGGPQTQPWAAAGPAAARGTPAGRSSSASSPRPGRPPSRRPPPDAGDPTGVTSYSKSLKLVTS